MDDLYDATFYTWLKSEDNVLVTASYLQRLAGEYDHDRIEHALCWLVHGWRLESIAVLVKQVTFEWIHVHGEQGKPFIFSRRFSFNIHKAFYACVFLTALHRLITR
jgi:hypothetical protein